MSGVQKSLWPRSMDLIAMEMAADMDIMICALLKDGLKSGISLNPLSIS